MDRARGAGDSAAARSAGSMLFLRSTWGLRPRLYSAVRFADSAPGSTRRGLIKRSYSFHLT
jgi:hypothetical protein